MRFKILVFVLCILCPSIMMAQNAVIVSWDANSEVDLAGYKVYYGFSADIFNMVFDVGNIIEYQINGLDPTTYYFAVTAYDTVYNESGYSEIVSASLGQDNRKPGKLILRFAGDTTVIDSVDFKLKYTCDNSSTLWLNGILQGGNDNWNEYETIEQRFLVGTEVKIIAHCTSEGYGRGFLAEVWLDNRIESWTNTTWQVSVDSLVWVSANDFGIFREAEPWINYNNVIGWEPFSPAHWIWAPGRQGGSGETDGGDLAPLECWIKFNFVIN